MYRKISIAVASAIVLIVPALAFGHAERPTLSPARPGSVPNEARVPTATLNVCKRLVDGVAECLYKDIQAAVNAAPNGAEIRIWPGLYEELPSRAALSLAPDSDGYYSYQHHVDNPNSQNLIAVVGRQNLTLKGMGTTPQDVVIDVGFAKHVGIRGDRADGLIIKNLSIFHAFDHGIYVLDQDGFIIDNVLSAWSRDYAFLTFAVDHGVIKNCEAIGAGDAGIYPGGTADTPGRHSVEVANCKSHHNVIGYSGTQGNYVLVKDSEFYDNAAGMTSDSETDHPNYPQKGLKIENSSFHENNFNPYSSTSDVLVTVAVNDILIPVGTGIFLASGNENTVTGTRFWGNNRYGLWLASGQAVVIGPTSDPPAAPFVSSNNRFLGNMMYPPAGVPGSFNGIDFAWDGMGIGNCWQGNTRSSIGYPATSDNVFLPPCNAAEGVMVPAGAPNPSNALQQAGLVYVEGQPLCAWMGLSPCIVGPGPTPITNARNSPEGSQQEWATPPTCGPSGCD